jgi:hypothetical protein
MSYTLYKQNTSREKQCYSASFSGIGDLVTFILNFLDQANYARSPQLNGQVCALWVANHEFRTCSILQSQFIFKRINMQIRNH